MEAVFIWLVSALIGIAISWFVIYTAVKAALQSHYKTVRWYEATGEWLARTTGSGTAPRNIGDK